MEDLSVTVYDQFKAQADKLGISLRKLCELSGVNYNNFIQWQHADPQSVQTYRKLKRAVETYKPGRG